MPKRIEVEEQRGFGGGLNLKDDPTNLADDETFNLQNVDIDRRGGFGVRRGSRRFVQTSWARRVTATGASRTTNVVTATGLSPVNGDPGGLTPGMGITVTFADTGYNGTFTVATAVAGATTATWSQTAANDAAAGAGTINETAGAPDSGYTYVDTSGVRHLLAARGGTVRRLSGTDWLDVISTAGSSSGRVQFAEFRNVLYLLRPNRTEPHIWSGSGLATQLTTAIGNYNDNISAPNDGNFPPCTAMAVHGEVMWAGNIAESGPTDHASRVRWSHPGRAQDWRTDDFIDLDPDDEHGNIRALVPFGDRLLVFKDKAVYAIHGYAPAGFSVQNLTKEIGTPSPFSVVATEQYVYFWDIDTGAWRYDGKKFEWIFEPLYRLIDDERINTVGSFQVIAEYHRDRLWLSVPWISEPYPDQFVGVVFQPSAGEHGAWTIHTRTLFGWWVHRGSSGGDEHLVGGNAAENPGEAYLYELDVENLFEDESYSIGPVFTDVKIDAHYTTRWFSAETDAMQKRWLRPLIVMRAGQEQETQIDVLKDYDHTAVKKTFSVFTQADGETGVWDDPASDWDVVQWADEASLGGEKSVIVRGSSLGTATSIALRFRNIIQGQDWRIHRLTMKWIAKRVKR